MTVQKLLTYIFLSMLVGCGQFKEGYENGFKKSFHKSFVKSCTENAMKTGVKESDAKGKCDCLASYLTAKYSSAVLSKLKATDSPESKQIFDEALNSCK